jgi:hypothetical protein
MSDASRLGMAVISSFGGPKRNVPPIVRPHLPRHRGRPQPRGIKPLRGRVWIASTIHGSAKRASGMICNEVYRGVIVWNRVDKPAENLARIGVDGAIAAFVKQPFRLRRALGWRQIEKRQEIARLVMGAGLLELSSSLGIDQCRRHVRKRVRRISCQRNGAVPRQRSPNRIRDDARRCSDDRQWRRVLQARRYRGPAAKPCCPLKRPILVEDDPLIDKSRPRQKIREACIRAPILR